FLSVSRQFIAEHLLFSFLGAFQQLDLAQQGRVAIFAPPSEPKSDCNQQTSADQAEDEITCFCHVERGRDVSRLSSIIVRDSSTSLGMTRGLRLRARSEWQELRHPERKRGTSFTLVDRAN